MTKDKCCCNCEHNKRVINENGIQNFCEIDNHYIGYKECFFGWCKKWKAGYLYKEKKGKKDGK